MEKLKIKDFTKTEELLILTMLTLLLDYREKYMILYDSEIESIKELNSNILNILNIIFSVSVFIKIENIIKL